MRLNRLRDRDMLESNRIRQLELERYTIHNISNFFICYRFQEIKKEKRYRYFFVNTHVSLIL